MLPHFRPRTCEENLSLIDLLKVYSDHSNLSKLPSLTSTKLFLRKPGLLTILSFGREEPGSEVRGVLFKNSGPGLIIIDDLEDPELIENKEYRDKLHQWLYADVIKAVPRIGPASKTWKIIYIDTLKHEDSVMQRLLDSPDWKSVRLEACDDNFKSTAPEFVSDEDIRIEWQKHVDAGQTDVFFRELRNLPISTKDSAFQQQYFKYYNVPLERPFKEGRDLRKTDAELQSNHEIELWL